MQYQKIYTNFLFILSFLLITSVGLFGKDNPVQNYTQLNKSNEMQKQTEILNRTSLNADTSAFGNKINKVWNNGQNMFIIKLNVVGNKDKIIKLSLVNLIGKEVKVIYEGYPKDSDWEYSFTYSEIPSGVYICVLSSADYRDAKKIVISK